MVDYIPLASIDDVESLLGRDLTSSEALQAPALIKQASELFRNSAGRSFTPGRFTNRLKVNGGEVRLSNSPVTLVHSVTDDDGNPIEYTVYGSTLTTCLRSHRFVRVDYEGGGDVPDIVTSTVAGMVARLFNVDARAKAGMVQFQKTAGPFSEGGTFAAWAVGGQLMMSPNDVAVAQQLRAPRLPNTTVLGER